MVYYEKLEIQNSFLYKANFRICFPTNIFLSLIEWNYRCNMQMNEWEKEYVRKNY